MTLSWRFAALAYLMVLCAILSSCGDDSSTPLVQSSRQGIKGTIYFWEGDFMPPNTGTITPVERDLLIYELTNLDQVTRVDTVYPGAFISAVETRLIKTVRSNAKGEFEADIQPGAYSLMVREGDLLYVNLFGGMGEIFPVEVNENKYAEVEFDITYMAVH